jgi:D-alanyl-D-alanine carboxypeptidase (penicillin-binding protein 5/6)
MALLARALIAKFPDYYGRWYSQREFTYNDITQRNRNALLWRDSTVDGVKTGMTEAAGYCLVASANRDNMRLISVVMGTPNANIRASASQSLLGYGFQFYETHKLFAAGEPLTSVRVWKGARERVDLGLDEDVFVIIPRGQRDSLNAEMDLNAQVIAPVTSDDELGTVRVSLNDEIVLEKPLHPLQAVASGDFFDRIMDEILLWFE